MRSWANVGLLLGQRRRRWANSKPTLVQHLMLARYRDPQLQRNQVSKKTNYDKMSVITFFCLLDPSIFQCHVFRLPRMTGKLY